jgi:hypothetical protein
MAFASEGVQMLALNKAAQEDLMRTGAAFTQIARIYSQVDDAARMLAFAAGPPSSHATALDK